MEGFYVKLKRVSNEDLCGEVYSLLLSMNIPFCRDYSYSHSRLNFVIVNSKTNKAIAIIEVRSKVCADKIIKGKRSDKHKGYGVPVFGICHIDNIRAVLCELLNYLKDEGYVGKSFVYDCFSKIDKHRPNQYVFNKVSL